MGPKRLLNPSSHGYNNPKIRKFRFSGLIIGRRFEHGTKGRIWINVIVDS